MKHRFSLEGYCYKLRPLKPVELPSGLSIDITAENIYYFTAENRYTKGIDGIISLCNNGESAHCDAINIADVAVGEVIYLLCKVAFEKIGCEHVNFNSKPSFKIHLKDCSTDCTLNRSEFYTEVAPLLENRASEQGEILLKNVLGDLEFHHLAVATKSIDKELPVYTLMGYTKEGEVFCDDAQGIKGLFITKKDNPRLELLENLEGSTTLDKQLEHNQKYYHTAYYVDDIEKAIDVFLANRAKIISPLKSSVYFGKRICFLMLPNMGMIELLER